MGARPITNSLSVIIIMHNEAHHIKACLDSVSFANEWIVVDSGSTDDSVQIATDWGATVIQHPWSGFGPQKNVALANATGDWVLSMDADERVSPALALEIQRVLMGDEYQAYDIPRLSQYCGQFMRHSGWWPDLVLRLFKRDQGSFSPDLVHERVVTQASTGRLHEPLLHYSYRTLEDVLEKANRYSSAGAQRLIARGKKISFSSALTHGLWAFVRTYLFQRGFLDGKHGLMLAISNAEGTYYRYLKAWLHQQKRLSPPSVTLIVTTYNRPHALRLVLASILEQSQIPDQVIVADDGSQQDTADLIQEFKPFLAERLIHVWHPDEGFRAAAIRNRAIEQATSDYIIFIDGDCILPPHFISRHQALAESSCFVSGSRILLSESLTAKLEEQQHGHALNSPWFLLKQRLVGGLNRLLPMFKWSMSGAWRKRHPKEWKGAKTCNLGVWRDDLLSVRGFDEAFQGWGMEDSDLVIRLQHAGVIHKNGRFSSWVFHLWHPENDRSQLTKNTDRLTLLIASERIEAEQGLSIDSSKVLKIER